MGRVQDKVILVSGGAMGMGRTHCELLAREGGQIIVSAAGEESSGASEPSRPMRASPVPQAGSTKRVARWASAGRERTGSRVRDSATWMVPTASGAPRAATFSG